MKKLLAVLMALSLLLVSFAAFAEEAVIVNVTFEEHKELAEKYPGQFMTVAKTGLMMYVPDNLKEAELTEEQLNTGLQMVLNTEDGKAVINETTYAVDIKTFIETAQKSEDAKVENVVQLTLNDVNAFEMDVTKDGITTTCICLPAQDDYTIVFGFSPTNEGSEYADMLKVMAASIQISK